jgi:hypothetical protein
MWQMNLSLVPTWDRFILLISLFRIKWMSQAGASPADDLKCFSKSKPLYAMQQNTIH